MPVNAASQSIRLPEEIAKIHDVQFFVYSRLAVDLEELNRRLKEHLSYLKSLHDRGILPMSGPFFTEDGKNTGNGFYVLRVDNMDEARRLSGDDPLHKNGVRTHTVEPWLQVVE